MFGIRVPVFYKDVEHGHTEFYRTSPSGKGLPDWQDVLPLNRPEEDWFAANAPGHAGEGRAPTEQDLTPEAVAAFVREHYPNLNGFVLFDNENRYEIDFPNGWAQPAKGPRSDGRSPNP